MHVTCEHSGVGSDMTESTVPPHELSDLRSQQG